MPNKQVFKTTRTGRGVPAATGKTSEGHKAYSLHPEQTLAELACVGTFHNTYYNSAETQLQTMMSLAEEVSMEWPEFLAKVAVYSRQKAHMKDMPAAFLALLSTKDTNLFNQVFHRVIDNVRMIRGFVQIMRSGMVGRNSLGSAPKKRVQEAIQRLHPTQLLNGSVGNDPSLADVIKLAHPRPVPTQHMTADEMKHAFAWILGKEWNYDHLPRVFKEYEAFKESSDYELPKVNFRLIDGLPTMTDEHWKELGFTMNWTTLRMNLNTLMRHKCLEDKALVAHAAKVLSDPDNVRKSKCFPYQLVTALNYMNEEMPRALTNALQDALEVSVENVPPVPGKVLVTVDISGSMTHAVSGDYRSQTSCLDVACLFGAVVYKGNPDSKVTAFSERLYHPTLNSRDSLATIAKKIKGTGFHGATNWDAAIHWALQEGVKFDAIMWFSDMEANLDSMRAPAKHGYWYDAGSTSAQKLLAEYRRRVNPDVKIITVNLAANEGHAQVEGKFDPNVLQIAGFSDRVFEVISTFVEGGEPGHWVRVINDIEV